MIAPKVVKLCKNGLSISDELAKNPSQGSSRICEKLFHIESDQDIGQNNYPPTEEDGISDLETAAECGSWGASKPSELFLKVSACCPSEAWSKPDDMGSDIP